jgi:hypothetical protein
LAKKTNDSSAIGLGGFLIRLASALALVLLTFNPSGFSAYHWISDSIGGGTFGPLQLLLIGVLLIGWAVFWFATWRALDTLGVVLIGIVLTAIVWLLIDIGLLKAESTSAKTWIILVCVAVVLAVGVSWSHLWRRMTGQLNVEHVDD